jgi:hypothetical protein
MRDKTHVDFIERWVEFMKNNPNKWKKIHTEFIDSQYDMHRRFLINLSKEKNGREKIINLYGIKNLKGYNELLLVKTKN